MVYQYLNNYGYFKVPAQIVGEKLEEIERKYGTITKEYFLEESRSEESSTHNLFEWNDSIAAEKYRLTQAGTVIRMIAIKVDDKRLDEPKTVRAFVNIERDDVTAGRFVNILSGMNNEEQRRVILKNALADLLQIKRKYENLTELAGVFSAIELLKEAI